jgi:hypothetical protein
MDKTKERALKIIDSTIKRLSKHNNTVVVLNPAHKNWRPLIRARRPKLAQKELFKLAETKQYNQQFIAMVYIFASKENAELRVECNLTYFKKGKKRKLMSFGDVICFTPKDVIDYSLTTRRIFELVKKMHELGHPHFRGFRKKNL